MTEHVFEPMRRAMVASQLRTTGVNDPRVVAAMGEVPRERFVPAERLALAYADALVPVAPGRALNPPMALGRLLTEARLRGRRARARDRRRDRLFGGRARRASSARWSRSRRMTSCSPSPARRWTGSGVDAGQGAARQGLCRRRALRFHPDRRRGRAGAAGDRRAGRPMAARSRSPRSSGASAGSRSAASSPARSARRSSPTPRRRLCRGSKSPAVSVFEDGVS